MPSITKMLRPTCPDHPLYRAEHHGRCCICEITTHKHLRQREVLSPEAQRMKERLAQGVSVRRVTYRTEAEAYDEGIVDDD